MSLIILYDLGISSKLAEGFNLQLGISQGWSLDSVL